MDEVTKIVFNEKTRINEEYRYKVMTGCRITFRGRLGEKINVEILPYKPDDKEIGELIIENHAHHAFIQEIKCLKESDELPFN